MDILWTVLVMIFTRKERTNMKDMKELDLNALNNVAGGENLPAEIDLLDPAQEVWREGIRSGAQARKSYLGTSLEQTIADIQESYRSLGTELLHLAEYLTPIWDTLEPLTPKSFD